jgi:hypothetical protein
VEVSFDDFPWTGLLGMYAQVKPGDRGVLSDIVVPFVTGGILPKVVFNEAFGELEKCV